MPSIRRMILGHVMSGMCAKMNRTKKFEGDVMDTALNRCLSTFDITLLGEMKLKYIPFKVKVKDMQMVQIKTFGFRCGSYDRSWHLRLDWNGCS